MLPRVEPVPKNAVLTLAGFILLLLYSFQNRIPGITSLSRTVSYLIVAVFFVVAVLVFLPELKRDVPLFFRRFPSYFGFFLPKFCVFLLIYYVVAFTLAVFIGEEAANQSVLKNYPLKVLVLLALFYAPILEEILYRGFLRRLIHGKMLFIVVSSLFFAVIHMLHPGQSFAQLFYIFDYALLGGFLAYLYVKTDNICVAMLGHFSLNLLALLPQLFLI